MVWVVVLTPPIPIDTTEPNPIMKQLLALLSLAALTGLAGCETTPEQAESNQRTLKGAAIGTAAGAIIGNQSGRKGRGAAIGGVTGAAIGNIRTYNEQQRDLEYQRQLNQGHYAY